MRHERFPVFVYLPLRNCLSHTLAAYVCLLRAQTNLGTKVAVCKKKLQLLRETFTICPYDCMISLNVFAESCLDAFVGQLA